MSILRPILAIPILCLLPVTATAQDMTAKDGWDLLRGIFEGAGLSVHAEGIDREGAALVPRNLVLRSGGDGPVVSIPALRLEPRGAEGVAVIPGNGINLDSGSSGFSQRQFTVDTTGALLIRQDGTAVHLTADMPDITMTLDSAVSMGSPADENFALALAGLAGGFEISTDPQMDVNGTLGFETLQYTLQVNDTFLQQDDWMEIEGVQLTIDIAALDLFSDDHPSPIAHAFAGGFHADLMIEAERSASRSDQLIAGTRIFVDSTGDRSEGALRLRDGMLQIEASGGATQAQLEIAGLEADVALESALTAFEMPLVAQDEDAPFALRLELGGLTASPETWANFNLTDFTGESADFALNFRGDGRWLMDLPAAFDANDAPLDFSALVLEQLLVRLGDSRLEGSGQFEPEPGSFSSPEPMPQGIGDFIFDLIGGEILLNRLSAAGLIPSDQQFLVRMMVSALGRSVGEDHLRSEVTIRPGGQLLVNGMPLPF